MEARLRNAVLVKLFSDDLHDHRGVVPADVRDFVDYLNKYLIWGRYKRNVRKLVRDINELGSLAENSGKRKFSSRRFGVAAYISRIVAETDPTPQNWVVYIRQLHTRKQLCEKLGWKVDVEVMGKIKELLSDIQSAAKNPHAAAANTSECFEL